MEAQFKKFIKNRTTVVVRDVNNRSWKGVIKYYDQIGIVFVSTEGKEIIFPLEGIVYIEEE